MHLAQGEDLPHNVNGVAIGEIEEHRWLDARWHRYASAQTHEVICTVRTRSPMMKQSFRALLVVTGQFLLSKWPNPFMSTHTHAQTHKRAHTFKPLIEPLGPDITALATGTNRALPASNSWGSCSILCVRVCMCVEKRGYSVDEFFR